MNSKMLSPVSTNCSVCQTETGLDDLFCQECGVSLAVPAATTKVTPAYEVAFEKIKVVTRLPVWVGVVLLLVVSTFSVFAWVGSYDSFSEDYICEHAKKLISQSNSEESAEILQRLYLARGQNLKKETVTLLGQCLIARSDALLAKGQKELAVRDLNAVPTASPSFDLAREKLKALVSPVVPVVPLLIAHTQVKAALSSKNVVKPPKIPPTISSTVSSSTDVPLSSSGTAREQAFASRDVARYNELLAGYFTKSNASENFAIEKDGKSEKFSNMAVIEPPTFKEWVSRGRPEF